MRFILSIAFTFFFLCLLAQDYYELARSSFNEGKLDKARGYIHHNLSQKPTAADYFLSAMIHEAEGQPLRALADYEAVVQKEPSNLEAYFQKGLIYYRSGSISKAIADFSQVLANKDASETKAIYFVNDPHGARGTMLTTLQSIWGKVYQYRGLAYKYLGRWEASLDDFEAALNYDSTADLFINRSQVHVEMGNSDQAIKDLKQAIAIEPESYLAWYNLALLDPTARLPGKLASDHTFAPLLQLMGANAYENESYHLALDYYSKALEYDPEDDFSLIGRGKSLIKIGHYEAATSDFAKAIEVNSERIEAFYLMGNCFFYQGDFTEAISFYEQYLSIDQSHASVWYNAAMSYFSVEANKKGCKYLKKASQLGMEQAAAAWAKSCNSP